MRELAGRILGRRPAQRRQPILSFGSWDRFPAQQPRVVQICHPDWRGVRTVAYSFRTPVVECDDLSSWGEELAGQIAAAGIEVVVIQGWPPGAAVFVALIKATGLRVKCVLHSSPVQHGAEPGEAAVVDEILDLGAKGVLDGVGMAKAGVPEAFRAIGLDVDYVPNRTPDLPEVSKIDLGEGRHVGVFAEPFWRKNVTTQLLAVGMLGRATAHVLSAPVNRYLRNIPTIEHGELPYAEFISLQGSVDLNLYVTLSECYPSTPQESYLMGVPCLISRVSSVFKSDARLWELTSVGEPDNPEAISRSSRQLLDNRGEAVERAMIWMQQADDDAEQRWFQFVSA